MKLELQKFNDYLVRFARDVLAPAAKSPATKFKIGWALGSGKLALAKGDEHYEGFVATGVIGDDGMVDLDQFKKCMESGLQMAGEMRIDKLGISVERAEVDKLYRLLETGSLG